MQLICAFLIGGTFTAAIYYFFSWSSRFSEHDNYASNQFNWVSMLLQIIPIVIAIVGVLVALHQIKVSLDEGIKRHKVEWLQNVHDSIGRLKSFRDELAHNLETYERHIAPNEASYVSGNAFHHTEYSVGTLASNFEKNTFEYDYKLFKRVMRLNDFLNEANRVFQQARSPGLSIQERSKFYSAIFSQHKNNLPEWRKLIQDVGEYANFYEAMASKASINSLQALTYGTKLASGIAQDKNTIVIMNVGGEAASDIKITCQFPESPDNNKKFMLPFLSVRQPVEYVLDVPRYSDRDVQGECEIIYQSEHSNGYKKINYNIKWVAENQKWIQTSNLELIDKNKLRVSLGLIGSIAPYEAPALSPSNLTVELNDKGDALKIKNEGGSTTSKIQVINEFGQVEGWRDITPQYMLEPGEEITVSMPSQNKADISFGGKILFQSEGSDEISYKILSFKWDNSLKRWRNGFL